MIMRQNTEQWPGRSIDICTPVAGEPKPRLADRSHKPSARPSKRIRQQGDDTNKEEPHKAGLAAYRKGHARYSSNTGTEVGANTRRTAANF